MQFLVVLPILVSVVASLTVDTNKEDTGKTVQMQYAMDCMHEAGVNLAVLANLDLGVFAAQPDAKTFKFVECFFKKIGFFGDDGNFNEAYAKEKLLVGDDKDKIEVAIDACKDLTTASCPCEAAYEFYKCFFIKKNSL